MYCFVLDDVMLSYLLNGPFPDGNLILQHDNSLIHKSRKVGALLQCRQVELLEWPAQSPDLNIIENRGPFHERRVTSDSESTFREVRAPIVSVGSGEEKASRSGDQPSASSPYRTRDRAFGRRCVAAATAALLRGARPNER
ncbi:hypothetical protein HPB50_003200 [Hyalomma asiaticum]|uniref:Uncharacterized protein n=1 Tax=Hyalomma asiaticum TaxID=266040 RepID=A0ACB7SC28_HYAAI|nr:hypothetical protein HPB50_003200 [Hyalomma asiaticum]